MARKNKPRTKSPRALPRSSRHARGQQPILDDARDVLGAARKHFKGIQAYDAPRKAKLLPKSRLDAYEAAIRAASVLVGGGSTRAAVSRATTRAEEKAREAVWEIVSEARAIVAAGVADDVEMRRAFLVGVDVDRRSTPSLTKAAADIQQAWENEAFHDRAVALGIAKGDVDALAKARRALVDANAAQHAEIGSRTGQSADQTAGLRKIEKETAHVRRVAKLAFKKQRKVLADFVRRTPKAIARPRKPPAPTPAAAQ